LLIESLNLKDADEVVRVLRTGAEACLHAPGRAGSCTVVDARERPVRLVATGDLHDNPLHLARLVRAAGIEDAGAEPAHLTLHELIHGDRLVNGLDYSYRVLARVAALTSAFPERVHPLLANHELAQLGYGAGIVKDGVRVVEAFDEALDAAFGEDAQPVRDAVHAFIRAMPLALRVRTPTGDVLCAHSLPGPGVMDRFDPGVFERDLTGDDLQARTGSAYLSVWGRGHTEEQVEALAQRLGVSLFVLGHEKAETGSTVVTRRTLVLNSDHERGVYLPLELGPGRAVPTAHEAHTFVRPLNDHTQF
jgi:hypothetical protein